MDDINQNTDQNAWRAPLVALAGDKPEYKTAIEGFKAPEELFQRLTAQPEQPDWRKLLAGDNADRLQKLQRFTDPNAFVDSFEQKDAYIASGRKVTVPKEGDSPEVIAAWNAARGVPEKPDGYQIAAKAPEGLEIDDATKGMLTGITADLHALGAEPAIVNKAHEIVYKQLAEAQTAQVQAFEEGPTRAKAELAKAWRSEAELSENIRFAAAGVRQFIGDPSSEEAKSILGIETVDGFYLGDHPAFVRLMAGVGRANAEDPLFLEASGQGGGTGSVQEQIDAIYALRASDMKKYEAPDTQARLQALLTARSRHNELQGRKRA